MTQTEWENEMCIKILDLIENELYIDFRYLDVAISTLILTPKESHSFFRRNRFCEPFVPILFS